MNDKYSDGDSLFDIVEIIKRKAVSDAERRAAVPLNVTKNDKGDFIIEAGKAPEIEEKTLDLLNDVIGISGKQIKESR